MADSKVLQRPLSRPKASPSPPANCAICLEPYKNKCFSDPCMHEFCFTCLLNWSKIKAECPLCKQPLKLIIHNIKSNGEYDEYVLENTSQESSSAVEFHLPTAARDLLHSQTASLQRFTTFLTQHLAGRNEHFAFVHYPSRSVRRRRSVSSTNFRRSIYNIDLWVNAPPDVTGRYRDVSPAFFRSWPSARQRLQPWLNRELNALLDENTSLVLYVIERIMDNLLKHHICSRRFRYFLSEYLGIKTDHFVHEFYNFMRSPFDMVGYDTHIVYTETPRSPAPIIDVTDEDSDDSDVVLISPTNNEVISFDSDSDSVIVCSEAGQPIPQPIIVEDDERSPVLPAKLRFKSLPHKKRRPRDKRTLSSSSSSDEETVNKTVKKKKKQEVLVISSDDEPLYSSSDSDDIPLAQYAKKKTLSQEPVDLSTKNAALPQIHEAFCKFPVDLHNVPSTSQGSSSSSPLDLLDRPSCSRYIDYSCSNLSSSSDTDSYDYKPLVKSEIRVKSEWTSNKMNPV